MIIWSRFGIFAPIIAFASLVLTEYSVEMLFDDQNYYQEHGWPKFLALLIAGSLCFSLGQALNKKKSKIYIDKETGEEIVVKKRHTFFFISIEYWAIIFPILGMALWLVDL